MHEDGADHNGELHTEVTHLPTSQLVAALQAGELDLGIFHDVPDHPGLEFEPLFPGEPLDAFLPACHRLVDKPVIGPEDLYDEVRLVGPRAANPALYDEVLARINEKGYRFRSVQEVTGVHARDLMLAVASGMGVTLAITSCLEIAGANSMVVRRPLDPPIAMPDVILAWGVNPPGQLQPALAAARQVARQLRAISPVAQDPETMVNA
jgi:DNA-binding transcriptional LysR family regulator